MKRTKQAYADRTWVELLSACAGTIHYFWSSLVVFLAYYFSKEYLIQSSDRFLLYGLERSPFINQDAQWYESIASMGYYYNSESASNVAFFPLYPMICGITKTLIGSSYDDALILVSNSFLVGCFFLLKLYLDRRYPESSISFRHSCLLAFAILPVNFFMRMGYSESCFVFILLVYLLLIQGGRTPLLIAMIAGLLTAVRSPGVALIPTTVFYLWRCENRWPSFLSKLLIVLPVSCWGLLAFMGYQYAEFGDPIAFARAQNFFKGRPTPPPLDKAMALITFEPIRVLFNSTLSPLFAGAHGVLFNLGTADPILFGTAIALLIYNYWRRLLNHDELILSVSLLMFTYISIGYESFMRSQGRYASVVIPLYFVMGDLLSQGRESWAIPVLSLLAILFFVYACMFFSGYFLV